MSDEGFLRWRSWGAGERRALLLHGLTSSSATWWRIGPALAEAGWRVKAPDLPSHGASPRMAGPLTPRRAAERVAAELAERPFDLVVGHAFGASVAVALTALRGQDGFLVLDEFPGPHSLDWGATTAKVQEVVFAARRNPAAIQERIRQARVRWAEEDCRNAARDLASCVPEDVAEGLRDGSRWPVVADIPTGVPTLVMAAPEPPEGSVGTNFSFLRGDDRQEVAERVTMFLELAGGHYLHRDDPTRWLEALTAFTDRGRPRRAYAG